MRGLYGTILDWLANEGWGYREMGECRLELGVAGRNCNYPCYIDVNEGHDRAVFYTVAPVNVPDGRIQGVAEFLTRANYGLPNGNFEMDYSDGEVRFRTTLEVPGTEPSPETVKSFVYRNIMTMDTYITGLLKVAEGSMDPEAAVRSCEERQ